MGEQAFEDFPKDESVTEPPANEIPKPKRRRAPAPDVPTPVATPAEALRAMARLVEVLIGTMPSDARDEAQAFLEAVKRL